MGSPNYLLICQKHIIKTNLNNNFNGAHQTINISLKELVKCLNYDNNELLRFFFFLFYFFYNI